MVSSRVLLIDLYKTVEGSFIILYPGGALKLKENKINYIKNNIIKIIKIILVYH